MGEPVIVDVVRTAFGKRGGALANWHPADLLGFALTSLSDRRRHRRLREPGG
jgi:acetyl-CoA acetyltransferase